MGKRSSTISVCMPINTTADLGIAIKRQREKRIKRLKRKHPSLFPNANANETVATGATTTKTKESNDNNN